LADLGHTLDHALLLGVELVEQAAFFVPHVERTARAAVVAVSGGAVVEAPSRGSAFDRAAEVGEEVDFGDVALVAQVDVQIAKRRQGLGHGPDGPKVGGLVGNRRRNHPVAAGERDIRDHPRPVHPLAQGAKPRHPRLASRARRIHSAHIASERPPRAPDADPVEPAALKVRQVLLEERVRRSQPAIVACAQQKDGPAVHAESRCIRFDAHYSRHGVPVHDSFALRFSMQPRQIHRCPERRPIDGHHGTSQGDRTHPPIRRGSRGVTNGPIRDLSRSSKTRATNAEPR